MTFNVERKRNTTALLLLFVTAAAILTGSLAQRYFGHVMEDPDLDFHDYYFAATVVRQQPHSGIYDGATDGNPQLRSAPAASPLASVARAHGVNDTELYLYPPLLADVLSPLTHLSLATASHLWRALNLLCVLLSALLVVRLMRLSIVSAECFLTVALFCCAWPVHEAVSLGQITPVLLLLWTLGIAAYAYDFPVLSAAAFALATAFKVTPVLLVPLFLIWKNWRWLASYAASLLAAAAVMVGWNGLANLLEYRRVVAGMGGILPALQNKCLGSVMAWLYYGRVFNLVSVHTVMSAAPHGLLVAIKAVDLLFYALCVWLAWRARQRADLRQRVLTVGLFALVTLALAPVSWRHGYTVALVPLALLWAVALRSNARGAGVWLLALASVSVGTLFFDLAASGPLPQLLKIAFASMWPLSCALLCLHALAGQTHWPDTAEHGAS